MIWISVRKDGRNTVLIIRLLQCFCASATVRWDRYRQHLPPFSLTVSPTRRRLLLPGELRPAARLGHLRVGVLRHHHAVLRDLRLRVRWHVRGHDGCAGQGRSAGAWRERRQSGRSVAAQFAPSPSREHVHTVASAPLSPHTRLFLP